jgi:hypothetical protein
MTALLRYVLLISIFHISNSFVVKDSRRNAIQKIISPIIIVSSSATTTHVNPVGAFPLGPSENRRQLEFCLVNVLRVKYWAQTLSRSIEDSLSGDQPKIPSDSIKAPYLEARLGGKALLTGKIGGGSNGKVYTLASFQMKDVIKDTISYGEDIYRVELKSATSKDQKAFLKSNKNTIESSGKDLIESLATLVEFDGLDNVQDPSPRSTLFLSQYTKEKAMYVKRILQERVVPSCETLLNAFGSDKRNIVENYVQAQYSNEVPLSIAV